MSKRLPSHTSLKQILGKCAFDPRVDGPSKIIVDAAAHNPQYAELRAVELIHQGLKCIELPSNTDPKAGYGDYVRCVDQAIGLLALARALRE